MEQPASAAPAMNLPPRLHGLQDLRAMLDPATPILVLVDPVIGEPAPASDISAEDNPDLQAEREAAWQRPVARIELAERVRLAPHQHPYLVELQGLDDPLLEFTLDLAHAERAAASEGGLDGAGAAAHRIGGWLQSGMNLPDLAKVLVPMMDVNTDARTTATYLRWPDRRVLSLLRHVVGDARITCRFGRLNRWAYLDARGRVALLRSAGEDVVPLRLGRDEWARLSQGEALHRTMAQWLGEAARRGAHPPDDRNALQLYAPVCEAVAAAQAAARRWPHRFTRPMDQAAWAVLSLVHPEMAHNEAVHALLQEAGSTEDPPEPLRYLHPDISTLLRAAKPAVPALSPRARR